MSEKKQVIRERRIFNNEGDIVGMPPEVIDKFACLEVVTNIDGSGIAKIDGKNCLVLQVTIVLPEEYVKLPRILTTNMSANMEIFPNVITNIYVGNGQLSEKVKKNLAEQDNQRFIDVFSSPDSPIKGEA